MAVRNTEPYLAECLDSILAQTYATWELIAVNDHSTDRSRLILNAYAQTDARIKVFDSPGKRLIPALREGYRHILGTLVNRMDSDDKMPDYKLEVMVNKWLDVGKGHIVAGGTQHFTDKGEVGDGFKRYDRWLNEIAQKETHWQEVYRECVIPSHCWLMHRNDLEQAGAFDSDLYPEDYDLCFRFYERSFKVVGIDRVLHYWRDREDRISRSWDEYRDNRYFDLKVRSFLKLDRNPTRPLVLWGAGKNGKDLARLFIEKGEFFYWICDNEQKIGKDIYGVRMKSIEQITELENPQILVAVASPDEQGKIKELLNSMKKKPVSDYWFFL